MKEADYAKDEHATVNVVLSVLVMIGFMYFAFENGNLHFVRSVAYFAVLAGCIWYPDAVAALKDDLVSPKLIRIGGWILLLVIVLYPYFLRMLSS
ncbi:MAG: hypothetical protein ACPG32_00555 [Akkermansiaceae bacterium]